MNRESGLDSVVNLIQSQVGSSGLDFLSSHRCLADKSLCYSIYGVGSSFLAFPGPASSWPRVSLGGSRWGWNTQDTAFSSLGFEMDN